MWWEFKSLWVSEVMLKPSPDSPKALWREQSFILMGLLSLNQLIPSLSELLTESNKLLPWKRLKLTVAGQRPDLLALMFTQTSLVSVFYLPTLSFCHPCTWMCFSSLFFLIHFSSIFGFFFLFLPLKTQQVTGFFLEFTLINDRSAIFLASPEQLVTFSHHDRPTRWRPS